MYNIFTLIRVKNISLYRIAFFSEDCIGVRLLPLFPSGHCAMNLFGWFDNRKEIKS